MTTTISVVSTNDANQTPAAVAGFLDGYCGNTRRSYATDLKLFAAWCEDELVALRLRQLPS